MYNDKTGGAAFPACDEANMNSTMGMTLRDYFAGQVISELLVRFTEPDGLDFGNFIAYADWPEGLEVTHWMPIPPAPQETNRDDT